MNALRASCVCNAQFFNAKQQFNVYFFSSFSFYWIWPAIHLEGASRNGRANPEAHFDKCPSGMESSIWCHSTQGEAMCEDMTANQCCRVVHFPTISTFHFIHPGHKPFNFPHVRAEWPYDHGTCFQSSCVILHETWYHALLNPAAMNFFAKIIFWAEFFLEPVWLNSSS